jgi:hypothetical protein
MITTTMSTVGNPANADPFVLRGLLWCGPCDELFVPGFVSTGGRGYCCPSTDCPRALVEARQVESAVWLRFAALNEPAAEKVHTYLWHHALIQVIKRVTVGRTADDLKFDWRAR